MSMYDKISKGIKLQHKEIKEETKINYNHRLSKDEMYWLNEDNYKPIDEEKVKLYLQDNMIHL